MTIETKYNIGDEVWVNDCDELVKCEIVGIRYELDRFGKCYHRGVAATDAADY